MLALIADEVLADVDVALGHLADAGIATSRIGIVGFCLGGTVTLVTAVHRDVGAAVTFYGGGLTEGRFGFDRFESGTASTQRRKQALGRRIRNRRGRRGCARPP